MRFGEGGISFGSAVFHLPPLENKSVKPGGGGGSNAVNLREYRKYAQKQYSIIVERAN